MASKKQYGAQEIYISKLKNVMKRLEVEKYEYNWDRFGAWVDFVYKGRAYKFEDSIPNAEKHGQKISYVSDIFARVVLSLEDIARMKERGIYDLAQILAGFPALPVAQEIPQCFRILGFDSQPEIYEKVTQRYRQLAKVTHPDAGGDAEEFKVLTDAYEQASGYYIVEGE